MATLTSEQLAGLSGEEFLAILRENMDGLALEASVRITALTNVLARQEEKMSKATELMVQATVRIAELEADNNRLLAELDAERETKMKTLRHISEHKAKLRQIHATVDRILVEERVGDTPFRRSLAQVRDLAADA